MISDFIMCIIQDLVNAPIYINCLLKTYVQVPESNGYSIFRNERVISLGASIQNNIDAVYDKAGYITLFKLSKSTNDVISCKFSGCIMARFKYDDEYYAAHIFTSQEVSIDTKYIWKELCCDGIDSGRITELIMFKPGFGIKANNVIGVITSSGDCYTIVVNNNPSTNEVSLYKIVRHNHYGSKPGIYNVILKGDYKDDWNRFWETYNPTTVFQESYNCCHI